MNRTLAGVALAALVLLSGCGGIADLAGSQGATATPTETATATGTPTETATATDYWSPPMPPNTPTQTADESGNRIESGEFVNKEAAEGGGYSDFDVRVTADTRMENIDPTDHGDAEGEPYFLVALNGKLVERHEHVGMKEGTFELSVSKRSLDQVEPGTVEVTVYLMDRDGTYDDLYGSWSGTIEYAGRSG